MADSTVHLALIIKIESTCMIERLINAALQRNISFIIVVLMLPMFPCTACRME